MSRELPSYDSVVEDTDPAREQLDHRIGVRVEERPDRSGFGERSYYTYYVVDHDREVTLFEGRPAKPYDQNPSSAEESARAWGFRQGYLAAHPDVGD